MKKGTSALVILLILSLCATKILVMEVEDLRKLSNSDGTGLRELFGTYSVPFPRPTHPRFGVCVDAGGREWKGTIDMDTGSCYRRLCHVSLGTINSDHVKCIHINLSH